MQPVKEKKLVGLSLLDRLRALHVVELGMELRGFICNYQLEGTKDKKILVSMGNDTFLGSATTIDGAIKVIADYESKKVSDYDKSKIKATYVVEEEKVETKIRPDLLPKRYPAKPGMQIGTNRFYAVKKSPDGKSSGSMYCLYNWDTRRLIVAHEDKDFFPWFLINRYGKIKHKDV